MTRLTLRLPDDVYERLIAVRDARKESLNEVVIRTIEEGLAHSEVDEKSERERVAGALGDLVLPIVRPLEELPCPKHIHSDKDLRKRMPRLTPPLSQTVIDDRGEI